MVIEGSKDRGLTWSTVAHVPYCMWGTSFVAKGSLHVVCVRQAKDGFWAVASTELVIARLDPTQPWSRLHELETAVVYRVNRSTAIHASPGNVLVHDGTVRVAIRGGLRTSKGFLVVRAEVSDDLLAQSSWVASNGGKHMPDLVRLGPDKSSTMNHLHRAFDISTGKIGVYASQGETYEAIIVELDAKAQNTPCKCPAPQLLMLARVNTISYGTRRMGAGLACNLVAQYLITPRPSPNVTHDDGRQDGVGDTVEFIGYAAMPGWGIAHNFIVKDGRGPQLAGI